MTALADRSGLHAHRRGAPRAVPCVLITVSDTRSAATDRSGDLAGELLAEAGHPVLERRIVPDEAPSIQAAVRDALARPDLGAVILTGGTGVAPRDVTPEAVRPLLERELPGFGELFRALSFREVGAAAFLSRAFAGAIGSRLVVALPGSPDAIRLGLEKLLLPELGHLVGQLRKARRRSGP